MSLKMMLDAKPACEVRRSGHAATKEFPLLQISSCYLHEAGHLYNVHVIGNNLITMWKLLRGAVLAVPELICRVKKLIISGLIFSFIVYAEKGEEQIKKISLIWNESVISKQ